MTLSELEALGFDETTDDGEGCLRVKCSRCEALVINGTPAHETGCPNQTRECDECGCPIPKRLRLCNDCTNDLYFPEGDDHE